MRRAKWLLGCAVAAAAGVSMAAGCGDDTTANAPMDSGIPDQTTGDHSTPDTGLEAATPEAEAAAPCMTDANLTMLDLPDASLDDAGDTVAGCIGCIETNCPSQVAACQTDCVCNVGVQKFIQCVASGSGALTCGTMLAGAGNANATALGLCVAGPAFGGSGMGCLTQCGAGYLLKGDGGDAAPPEGGGDATTDSSAGEAGSDATSVD